MNQCLASFRADGSPGRCLAVNISAGVDDGHVILKDIKGPSHFLLIPTRKITGIDDPLPLHYRRPQLLERRLCESDLR